MNFLNKMKNKQIAKNGDINNLQFHVKKQLIA